VVTTGKDQYGVRSSNPISKYTKEDVLAELIEVSKDASVDNLIRLMTIEKDDKEGDEAKSEEGTMVGSQEGT